VRVRGYASRESSACVTALLQVNPRDATARTVHSSERCEIISYRVADFRSSVSMALVSLVFSWGCALTELQTYRLSKFSLRGSGEIVFSCE